MNENYDLKEVIVTWICYSVVLICSFLISELIHMAIGISNTIIGALSIVLVTQILVLIYRIVFENEEATIENMAQMYAEIGKDLLKFLFICFLFFGIFKMHINLYNCILVAVIFTVVLMFI